MKKTFIVPLLAMFALTLVLTGCQSAEDTQKLQDTAAQKETEQLPVVDKGVPFSNGPSMSPDEIIGPDAPPSEAQSVPAQAVTTNENIRITLPRKTE